MNEPYDFGKILMRLRHIRYGDVSFRAVCPKCGRVEMKYDGKFDIKK